MPLIRTFLSFLFTLQIYLVMALLGIAFFPFSLFSRKAAFMACHLYCHWVIWTARLFCGIKTEIRGTPPSGATIVAAKHHSFFDILVIFSHLEMAKFIIKHELLYMPFFGQYGKRIGSIAVKRNQSSLAMAKMQQDIMDDKDYPGQLVIYPQGTRTAYDEYRPYKRGVARIYAQLRQSCTPVATNIGAFWPKRGLPRVSGTAVVEFLPAIEPGLSRQEFMTRLEHDIETHSNRLLEEAGFKGAPLQKVEAHKTKESKSHKRSSSQAP